MSPRLPWLIALLLACAAERAAALAPALPIAERTACEDAVRLNDIVPEPVRLILPCALAEHALVASGYPSCADAAIYIVTDAGVLLCQIDVSALASSIPLHIESAPVATMSTSSAFAASAVPACGAALAPPLAVDLLANCPELHALPRDGFARPPVLPS